ncbi:hypothetical protein [Streptomyces sp. NBC_00102]|uniref:hypothetical protein n=1 Tax=Streptomyces sp. NBC_00102 TaxID=2975652 RepID=UPI002257BBBD|nr:hypothetical protein [Streptomyces sp. NBC_00102]MCX5397121.1 hypothetical protein [Streptomyces sp. NBC_00102]
MSIPRPGRRSERPGPRRTAGPVQATVAALALALTLPATGTAFAAPASPEPQPASTTATGSAADRSWSVTHSADGYHVTLKLDDPLPVRDALPEIAVDGASLGYARQTTDGHTLSLVTSDLRAAHPDDVRVAWNGATDTITESRHAPRGTGRHGKPTATAASLTEAATAKGRYHVARADYDFGDTAVTLGGLSDRSAELRAAVWVPTDAKGERPVVLFLHGRHSACWNADTSKTNNAAWPCPEGYRPIPSYLGYNATAETLASQGYAVVSVSADGINAQDASFTDDAGTLARGQLVLDHLDLLARADKGTAPGMSRLLKGRLDLSSVGLMGHSRGGEGVVKAALLNAGRAHPYGIDAVLPLAPIDFGRETLPDVPMAVVLPYCDGDVSNQQGQHFYDDSRYTGADDDVLRSSLMVMGADHNFFNTEWTPGVAVAPASDDWSASTDAVCGGASPTTTRLTAAEQSEAGTAIMSGFFQLTLGGQDRFLPLFDGSLGKSTTVGEATVYSEAQAPGRSRSDIAPLTGPASHVTVTGGGTGTYCAGFTGRPTISALGACTSSTGTSRFPSWTPANYAGNVEATPLLHLTWPDSTGAPAEAVVEVPKGSRDVRRYDSLAFRAAVDENGPDTDLTVRLTDGRGRTAAVALSSLSDALKAYPSSGTSTLLPKTWLQTVNWPLAKVRGIDLSDVRRITLTAPATAGGVYLSDVAFQSVRAGSGGPSELPQVSVAGTSTTENAGTAPVTVTLSRSSRTPVTVNLQTVAGTGTQLTTSARKITFPARTTSVTVPLPVTDDTAVQPAADTVYKIYVSVPVGAVIGQDYARVTVHDDESTA